MKINNIKGVLALATISLSITSCDDYLDKMPDNRAVLDTEDKAVRMLTGAYPGCLSGLFCEFMSDNVDDYGHNNPNTDRFADQMYYWEDITESDNESPESYWEDAYASIGSANEVLKAIEEMGGATTEKLRAAEAEALLLRAYSHFMLTNIFCMHYNKETSETDLGVPYITAPTSKIGETYERGTVAEDYRMIEADLQKALPNISDINYQVPKYHFNKKAAYAFATRFYLFYEKNDSVLKYSNLCLGSQANAMLRDWQTMGQMTQTVDAVCNHYIDASLNCNLLLGTGYSKLGLVFGPYRVYSRYSHGRFLSENETAMAPNVWGNFDYYSEIKQYSATNLDKAIFWRLPYLFEYTDAVAGIGYYRTVAPLFTADEVLLSRAEAKILLGQFESAVADLNTWMHNIGGIDTNTKDANGHEIFRPAADLTVNSIANFYNSVDLKYAYSDDKHLSSSVKKHLNPSFAIDVEGSVQEALLQCVLNFRRIETLQTGLRWFDVKRYGIEIVRREMNASGNPAVCRDILSKGDLRRAVQIPVKVRQAGLQGNPR